MEEEILYCVVATYRWGNPNNRIMLTSGMSKQSADKSSALMQSQSYMKKDYKYFKVAKYPFKERK